jgi:hypothetical protein
MAIQHACDCCRNFVDVVDTDGLCMACYMVQSLKSVVTEHSDLKEKEINDLAVAVQITVLTLVIARLRVPGQEHPFALELEQWMAPRDEQRH